MEASTRIASPILSFEPNTEKIKRNLFNKGVIPTPKILHTLRKKEIQKFNRKSKKLADKTLHKPLSESEKQTLLEESHFRQINREYKHITKAFKSNENASLMVGKPWERLVTNKLKEFAMGSKEFWGGKLKGEPLVELSEILEKRNCNDDKNWLLDEDIQVGDWMEEKTVFPKRQLEDTEAIQFLVKRLSATDLTVRDWKFARLMKQSGLLFTERHLLKIVQGLGAAGCWKHALSVVKWIYNRDEHKQMKSRFVYTKLLAVLGRARQPTEALQIFNQMREDCRIYPDMAAYHSISVTLVLPPEKKTHPLTMISIKPELYCHQRYFSSSNGRSRVFSGTVVDSKVCHPIAMLEYRVQVGHLITMFYEMITTLQLMEFNRCQTISVAHMQGVRGHFQSGIMHI